MKTKNTILALIVNLFCVTSSLQAQQLKLEWAKQMSGSSSESGTAMAMDSSGNIYTIGSFYQTVDFDPSAVTFTLTSNGASDIFITKLDAQGNFLWAKQIGGADYDYPGNIAVDAFGNVLVGGTFRGTVDLNPGAGEQTVISLGQGAFLLKLDTNGNFMWAKYWGGNNSSASNYLSTITLDSSNNIILSGSFTGTNDLNPGTGTFTVTANNDGDAYISKLDTNGDFLWAMAFGVSSDGYAGLRSLALDASGNIVATGFFSGTIANYNLQNGGLFYIKLDASGNLIWAKQTDGPSDRRINSMKLDEAGNVYMVGRFGGTQDFDPGPDIFNLTCSSGYSDIFILKLNASGNFVWAKGFGGSASLPGDSGNSIVLDNNGYLYVTGSYVGSGDFNPGTEKFILPAVGRIDMFILKLDTDGNFVYANSFGATPDGYSGETVGNSLIADASGNIFCTGSFQNATDFNPGSGVFNLVSKGNNDVFILKLSQTATVGITQNTFTENIQIYPNPTTGNFFIKFETVQKDLSVRIMSISGQTIETRTFQNTDFVELKLEQPNGFYLVELRNEKGNKTGFRLIKK
ncbi:hypothetical protein MASR2M47_33680 [Draconibacterium sp.]|jgi:hypothetical protein